MIAPAAVRSPPSPTDGQTVTWFARRMRVQLAPHLADGESVVAHTDCSPLSADATGPAPDDVERTAVLTDRGLYYVVGGDRQVVALPFARMHQVSRRGLALLLFRIDEAQVTWELASPTFASRAERQFRAHGLAAHREWVGGREPAGFLHRAHGDLLARLAAGTPFGEAVGTQAALVADLVHADTGDRAYGRAAVRRLARVHLWVHGEIAELHAAMPTGSTAQHAAALAALPSPWPEDAVAPDDYDAPDDSALHDDVLHDTVPAAEPRTAPADGGPDREHAAG